MNFIKKIADKNFDEKVHLQFQKFSKGQFPNRALIEAKDSNGNYTIKTSAEFANELVMVVAEKLGSDKTNVTGAIISTSDLKNDLKYKEIKQFQGVKRYMIESEMTGEELIELLNKFPKTFFALSFSVSKDNTSLKIKPKAPKSGKPKTKEDEKPKVDFCLLKTTDKKLAEEFIFEKTGFKKAQITHDFLINDIEIPEELKGSDDFAKMREMSKRVGKIIRKSMIDDIENISELDFNA
jgi:hypothetical protein